jgi:hypothetical protein
MPYGHRVTWYAPWTFALLLISTICLVIIAVGVLDSTRTPQYKYKRMRVDSFDKLGNTEWELVFCDGRSCVFKKRVL